MSYPKKDIPVKEKNEIIKGTLYLVSTPIGNLSDLSERALKTLREVDFIAAEDTRNTGVLLSRFDISKKMVSYFEHNKRERGEIIASRIQAGESCALVTDAGTPAISDPGEDLVRLCREKGIPVTAVPGPCAAIDALSISGLSTGRFVFEGFIGTVKNERMNKLNELKREKRTIVFYEAPHRLVKTLNDLYSAFGERRISLCRELTKINEEVLFTTLSEAIEIYTEKAPKGEYVIICEGCPESEEKSYPDDISEHVGMYISSGMKKMDAIKEAAKDRGVAKSEIYKLYIGDNE